MINNPLFWNLFIQGFFNLFCIFFSFDFTGEVIWTFPLLMSVEAELLNPQLVVDYETCLRLMHMRSMILENHNVVYFDYYYKNYLKGISLDDAIAIYKNTVCSGGEVYVGENLFLTKEEIEGMLRPEVFIPKKGIVNNIHINNSPEYLKNKIWEGYISSHIVYDVIIKQNKDFVLDYYVSTGMAEKSPADFTLEEKKDLMNALILKVSCCSQDMRTGSNPTERFPYMY